MRKKYIGYYRVSTGKQGDSGLGLESQKQAVREFIKSNGVITNEYVEIESGTNDERPELLKAIEDAKNSGAILLIAKLDRLSRNAKFIFTLRDSGVKFVSVDMPDANNLTIGILAVLAQEEAEKTSLRTKGALKVIKQKIEKDGYYITKAGEKITKLGSKLPITPANREKGLRARKLKAFNNPNNLKAGKFIVALHDAGYSFYHITKELNASGFKTARGKEFKITSVKRLYDRYSNTLS